MTNSSSERGIGEANVIFVSGAGHLLDGAFALVFILQKGGHYTENVGAVPREHDAGVDPHAIELARFVGRGDAERQAFAEPALLGFFQQVYGWIDFLDGLQEPDQFVGRRYIFVTAPGGGRVHHVTAQLRAAQAERPHARSDVVHAEAIDEQVGRGVVAERDHQRRVVANGQRWRSHLVEDAAAADGFRAIERDRFIEPCLYFRGLREQLEHEREL